MTMAMKKRWIFVLGLGALWWIGTDGAQEDGSVSDLEPPQQDVVYVSGDSERTTESEVVIPESTYEEPTKETTDVPAVSTAPDVPVENPAPTINVEGPASSTEVVEPDENYYFDGKTLVTDDFTIYITDVRFFEPGEGNNVYGDSPTIAFWFDITAHDDIGNREVTPNGAWISTFETIQDNNPNAINKLRVGSLPDHAHLESQMQVIKPGGTISSSMSYLLDDLQTPVELIAVANMFTGEEYGSQLYKLN